MIKTTITGNKIYMERSREAEGGLPIIDSMNVVFEHLKGIEGKATIRGDMRGTNIPDSLERKAFRDVMTEHKALLEEKVAGWAIITDNQLIMGITTVVDWFLQPNFPRKHFASPEEATKWLKECQKGLPDVEEKAPKPKTKRCPYCKGRKTLFTTKLTCLSCDGTGEVPS